jgi:nicotinate-nucleotide pyrophosphorylase (carboxylating)
MAMAALPPWIVLDSLLQSWLAEDIGRGDRTTQGIFIREAPSGKAEWIAKEAGIIAGLPIAARVFQLLNQQIDFIALVEEGATVEIGETIAQIEGQLDALLVGERVALNLAMRLSGIATLTQQYVKTIANLPTRLVDTRKTTPGLRILEKYATQVGGAVNHRLGLDDAVMLKDNHIVAAGGIAEAIALIRKTMPYPLTIEVETTTMTEIEAAIEHNADIIMLDNMTLEQMKQAVRFIRKSHEKVKIEASGNITLSNIRAVAETGIDYISSSAPITRSTWLDLSMRLKLNK